MKYTHKKDYHVTTKQKSALLNTVGSHTKMHMLMKKPKFKVVQLKKKHEDIKTSQPFQNNHEYILQKSVQQHKSIIFFSRYQ